MQRDDGLGARLRNAPSQLPLQTTRGVGAIGRGIGLQRPIAANGERRGDASPRLQNAEQAQYRHAHHKQVCGHQIVLDYVGDSPILTRAADGCKAGSTRTSGHTPGRQFRPRELFDSKAAKFGSPQFTIRSAKIAFNSTRLPEAFCPGLASGSPISSGIQELACARFARRRKVLHIGTADDFVAAMRALGLQADSPNWSEILRIWHEFRPRMFTTGKARFGVGAAIPLEWFGAVGSLGQLVKLLRSAEPILLEIVPTEASP